MTAIVSRKLNSVEEVMKVVMCMTGGMCVEPSDAVSARRGKAMCTSSIQPVTGAAEANVRAVPGEQGLGDEHYDESKNIPNE